MAAMCPPPVEFSFLSFSSVFPRAPLGEVVQCCISRGVTIPCQRQGPGQNPPAELAVSPAGRAGVPQHPSVPLPRNLYLLVSRLRQFLFS